jgi:hypothetical protein
MSRQAKWQQKVAQQGRCRKCGSPRGETGTKNQCRKCADKQNIYALNAYYRRKTAKEKP